MAKAELKAFLGINSKQFERGLAKARAQANDFAKKGMMAAGAAVISFGAVLAAGSKRVMGIGADLDHVRKQSGAAVKDLMVLQRAMKDNGISASALGRNLRELNVNLDTARGGSGKAAEALSGLGLNAEDLIKMNATDRIKTISTALNGIEDPARRSAMAIALLGSRGSEMITGMNASDIDDAAKSLGKMPEIMDQFAASFERVDTIMGRLPDLADQFFTGFASEIVGSILGPLEQVNELDFSELGQKLGKAIAPWIEAVKGGEIWELFSLHASKAVTKFGAMIIDGFANAMIVTGALFYGVFKAAGLDLKNALLEAVASMAEALVNIQPPEWLMHLPGVGKLVAAGLGKAQEQAGKMAANIRSGQEERKPAALVIAETIANAPELNLRGKVDEAFDPAIAELTNNLQARADTNREAAMAMRGEDPEVTIKGDLSEPRESALAGAMSLAGSGGSSGGGFGMGASTSSDPTDFWRVIERGLDGSITNWSDLSDKQRERFADEMPPELANSMGIEAVDQSEAAQANDRQERQATGLDKMAESIESIKEMLATLLAGPEGSTA